MTLDEARALNRLSMALKFFRIYTAGKYDLDMLRRGPAKASCRAHIMSELRGKSMPQSKSGINALRDALCEACGVKGETIVAREEALRKYAEVFGHDRPLRLDALVKWKKPNADESPYDRMLLLENPESQTEGRVLLVHLIDMAIQPSCIVNVADIEPVLPFELTFGKSRYLVPCLYKASEMYCRERDASGEGASTFPTGEIVGTPLRVSYNGRIWDGEKLIFEPREKRLKEN